MGRQLLSFQNQENLVISFFEVVISLCTGKFITLKKFELLVKIKNTQIFGVTWLFWRSPNFFAIFLLPTFPATKSDSSGRSPEAAATRSPSTPDQSS